MPCAGDYNFSALTPTSAGWNSRNRPLLFAAESLFQQMFGLEVWMCLRCPWSLTTTYPTTENSTYTGKIGLCVGGVGGLPFPKMAPFSPSFCLHRIGRSGRYGRKGVAINFVKNDDIRILRDIEQYYSTQIDEMPMNGECRPAPARLLPSSSWELVCCTWKRNARCFVLPRASFPRPTYLFFPWGRT